MHIGQRYHRYLDHLGPTVPVRDLVEHPGQPDLVALRHDVDHDVDIALEMAYWEHEHGSRSTYFLLHTAPYWDDPRLLDKALQLQDFGHEVGLHVNVVAQWAAGSVDDPAAHLHQLLGHLRGAGLQVTGISAHGDPLCYEHQVINYWCFSELRPGDPAAAEAGLSAEGVPTPDERFRIAYPPDHRLRREDGATLELWQTPLADLGLTYEAVHVPVDGYFTDSGGSWARSPDPLEADLSRGRHQVLMHPMYWRDAGQRLFFFLSTARAGSKWLATVLDEATPLTARHELTLNHRYTDDELVPDKRTAEGFAELAERPAEVRRLLVEARRWMQDLGVDYAEANVYLAHFPELLDEVFPDATLVHLHRDPRDVVRSLLNRDWYDTPHDSSHPRLPVAGWDELSQLERVCWYVRQVTDALAGQRLPRITSERMFADPDHLRDVLREADVAFYPRLAEPRYGEVINASTADHVPPFDEWQAEWQETFARICTVDSPEQRPPSQPTQTIERVLLDVRYGWRARGQARAKGAWLRRRSDGLQATPRGRDHLHVLLGGGAWHRNDGKAGWAAEIGAHYRGEVDARAEGGTVALYCLMYDEDGRKIAQRRLGMLRPPEPLAFAFATRPDAARFDLALYSPREDRPGRLAIRSVTLLETRRLASDGRG